MTTVPAGASAAATQVLAGLPEHRQERFALRLERWWDDLHDGLGAVYPAPAADVLALRLIRLAAVAYRDRDAEPLRLDLARTLAPDWFQQPAMRAGW